MTIKNDSLLTKDSSSAHTQCLKTTARKAYNDQKKPLIKDAQITELLPMVHKIAQRVISYIKPPLTYEDMISAGTLGLIKAAKDFDPSQQAEFKTYAYIRIKGAILDEMRKWSFVPTHVNKQIQKVHRTAEKLTEENGNSPNDEQIAEKMGITIDQLFEIYKNNRTRNFLSLDAFNEEDSNFANIISKPNTNRPEQKIEKEELIRKVTEAIEQLNEKERQVIILYYKQELTMKEIAKVFDITEPRVSQLHAEAIFKLSNKMRQWNHGIE